MELSTAVELALKIWNELEARHLVDDVPKNIEAEIIGAFVEFIHESTESN